MASASRARLTSSAPRGGAVQRHDDRSADLYDRERFLERALAAFGARLARLGARRIWRGSAWIWDLKPDYRPGEVFGL